MVAAVISGGLWRPDYVRRVKVRVRQESDEVLEVRNMEEEETKTEVAESVFDPK